MMDLLKRFEEDAAEDELAALDEDNSDDDGEDDLASKLESMDLGKSPKNLGASTKLTRAQIMHHTTTCGLHLHPHRGTNFSGRSTTLVAIWLSNYSQVRSSRTRSSSRGGPNLRTTQRMKAQLRTPDAMAKDLA